jgi:hypothetical protein
MEGIALRRSSLRVCGLCRPPSRMMMTGRVPTAQGGGGGDARPMTSVTRAGYTVRWLRVRGIVRCAVCAVPSRRYACCTRAQRCCVVGVRWCVVHAVRARCDDRCLDMRTTALCAAAASVQSAGRPPGQGVFDPLKQRAVGPAPPLAEKSDNSPEDLAREMEKQVNRLIEASAEAAMQGDFVQALERAKEAVRVWRFPCDVLCF